MTLSDSERHELQQALEAKLGQRATELFMSTVPPPGDDPASRRDVSDAAQVLRGEVESVRGELESVRGEVGSLRTEVRADIGSLREDMRAGLAAMGEAVTTLSHDVRNLGVRMDAEFVAVRGEIKAEGGRVRSQMWLGSFTAAATAGALVLAAVTLT